MKQLSKKRNGELDFWKFIFSIVVVLHHSYMLFDGEHLFYQFGSTAVEFFFVVSGYLFASSIMRKKEPYNPDTIGSETSSFIFKKTYGFIYYFLFAVVLKVIVNILIDGFKTTVLNHKFFTIIFDCLFLNMTGLKTVNIIVATWYISAMLLAMAIIYPIFRKKPDLFINVIAPVTALFLYGIMMKRDGYLGDQKLWYTFITKGMVRAFAGLSLGCFCYKMTNLVKTHPLFTQSGRLTPHILSIVDIVCLGGSVVAMYEITELNCEFQPVIVFAIAVGITICASQKASISKLFSGRFFAYLGKLSTSVFFCHAVVIGIMRLVFKKSESLAVFKNTAAGAPIAAAVLVVGSVILGIICLMVCDPIKKAVDGYISKLKERAKTEAEV